MFLPDLVNNIYEEFRETIFLRRFCSSTGVSSPAIHRKCKTVKHRLRTVSAHSTAFSYAPFCSLRFELDSRDRFNQWKCTLASTHFNRRRLPGAAIGQSSTPARVQIHWRGREGGSFRTPQHRHRCFDRLPTLPNYVVSREARRGTLRVRPGQINLFFFLTKSTVIILCVVFWFWRGFVKKKWTFECIRCEKSGLSTRTFEVLAKCSDTRLSANTVSVLSGVLIKFSFECRIRGELGVVLFGSLQTRRESQTRQHNWSWVASTGRRPLYEVSFSNRHMLFHLIKGFSLIAFSFSRISISWIKFETCI